MESEKIRKVYLRQSKTDKSYHQVTASIDGSKDFVLEYYDRSPTATAFYGGSDYEYSITVREEWKDSLLLHLIKDRDFSMDEFDYWCYQKGIDRDSWTWSGS